MPRDKDERKHSRHRSRSRERSPRRESSRRSRRESKSPESRERRHKEHHRSSRTDNDRANEAPSSVGGYRGSDNPFNDAALGKKFVWKKKIEQDRALGLSEHERVAADQRRREEAERELENLRKRREMREIEKKQRDDEMARIRREQEQEKLGDWERREEEFHLRQAKKRAEIRIKNHRPKPIDILAMGLRLANETLDEEEVAEIGSIRLDVNEPHRIVECLDDEERVELRHDVEMYLSLETNARNVEFWENMLVVCTADAAAAADASQEVRDVLKNKSLSQLLELEADVHAKLTGKGGAVDVDFWEQVRRELTVEKAKATLSEMHADILERRLERLKHAKATRSSAGALAATKERGSRETSEVELRKRQRLEDLQRRILDELPPAAAASAGVDVVESGGDRDLSREMYEAELHKEHDPSEAMFSVEAAVPQVNYSWQDKHRPRKPRYFNRVHTGYEWNKYNQTHYDKDNPPPKVVQGYKFNIFYPDLIDKSSAPTYRVERDPMGGEDTVILRFIAGPPYEDVAFRIVNREWEWNRRRGFKNVFDRGVLQLHFRFMRHFYRR
ncbi:hypothetical protein IWW38_002690 [Coemansia aciculifera]|uniref:Uncharacterized protein n=1 Tax=Coemansia aciculifera TaxID=417176 RepID=A0ACC1M375_9FUNG|nr:hypothetical protein IWW38_002690 [Coemansia aciculifera]